MKSILYVIISVSVFISCGKTNQSDDITSDRKSNLRFSKGEAKDSTVQFVTNFTLNKDVFLNLHFELEEPLVNSLQNLSPELTEDELLEKGNFQFIFIVDQEVIYVENLDKGAGLKASKTQQLTHTVPLVAPEQLDNWGWFMWLKFMKLGGGQDALGEGKHNLTIEVRPYIQDDTLKVGDLIAKGSIVVNVAKISVDENLIPIQEIKADSGWEISMDAFNHERIEKLNRKIAEGRFENINGIVVVKKGKLLLEEYFNGSARDSLHDPRSVGKSIASSILGIAIDEGYVKNENARLTDFYDLTSFENYSTEKDSITLKSLLTMSSAFDGDDSDYTSLGNEENMYPTRDWVKFALDLPLKKEKKSRGRFSYFTAGVVVLGDIIDKTVPKGLVAYADEKLFHPLGIKNYQWEYTPQGVGNTAGGLRLRALDFAKYGQLYKNNGVWEGHQLISEDWVKKSLGRQVTQSLEKGYYGYLFWNNTFTINGRKYEVSYCSGNGGNKIYIFKDLPLVVVITSSAYNNPNAHANADMIVSDYLLPAIMNS